MLFVAQDKTSTLHTISALVLRATGAVGLSEFGMIDGEQLPSILDSVLQSKSSLLLQLSDASLKHDEKVKELDDALAQTEDKLAETQAALQGLFVRLFCIFCACCCPGHAIHMLCFLLSWPRHAYVVLLVSVCVFACTV